MITLAVLNRDEGEAVENTARSQSVLEGGVRINGGPDARWVDEIGETASYETLGRLSVATFTDERDDNDVLRWAGAIERDAIRWYTTPE